MKPKSKLYNYVIIDYLDVHSHHIVQRGLIRGRVGMKVNIRDQVQLKAGYKLCSGQKMTARVKDRQSEQILNVVPIHHKYCYYLTIHVVKTGTNGQTVNERPQYKMISGYVGDEWWLNDTDFKPAGYHLAKWSSHVVKITIKPNGLSRSNVTWRYVADHVKKDHSHPVRVQYVNQHHVVVGTERLVKPSASQLKVKVPSGYQYNGHAYRDADNRAAITVPVIGKPTDPEQSLVSYTIVKFSRTGRVLGCERCVALKKGRIGDSFRFRPMYQIPKNFHLSGNPVISGIFTPKGTRLNRGLITLMRLHSMKRQMVKA